MYNTLFNRLYRFCLTDRDLDGAFKFWSDEDIKLKLDRASALGDLFYTFDNQGQLNGLALVKLDHRLKTVHIEQLISTNRGTLKHLFIIFRDKYPYIVNSGWNFIGNRNKYTTCAKSSGRFMKVPINNRLSNLLSHI